MTVSEENQEKNYNKKQEKEHCLVFDMIQRTAQEKQGRTFTYSIIIIMKK